ncbi:MAG: hypothetical protein SNG02_02275 [Rikenellaceae bacterium]
MKKRWLSSLLMLLAASLVYGQGRRGVISEESLHSGEAPKGDVVSPSGDSLVVREIVRLTSDGVVMRDLYRDEAKAKELFEEALRVDPADVSANYQMAILLQDKDATNAQQYAQRAFEGDTTNKWSMELLAQLYVIGGRYNDASDLYKKLVKIEPNSLDFYRILAILYQYTNRPYAAISVLDSAELKVGKNPYLSQIKQSLLLSTLQTQRALEEAQEVVANTPTDIEARVNLAEVYAQMKQDSLVEVEYRAALQIDSTAVNVLKALGKFYEERGRTKEYFDTMRLLLNSDDCSVEEGMRVIQIMVYDQAFHRANYIRITELISTLALRFPTDKRVVEIRANNLIAMGLLDEALELYKRHTLDRPAQFDFFQAVIDIETYKERRDSADVYISRAIELFPDNVNLYITKANTKVYAKEYGAAIDTYKEAINHSSSDTLSSAIWGLIGDVEYQISLEQTKASAIKKAMGRCYDAYDRALKLYANNIVVLNNYAYFICEEEGGDLERALLMSTLAIELDNSNPTHLDTHAWILFKLGRLEEATKYMRTAISLDKSKSPELPLHYGDILAAQGNNFMAEIYWKKAVELGYSKEEVQKRIDNLKANEQ